MIKDKIAVPHVSFDAAKKAVNALYVYKKPGSAKEIRGLANLNETNTSKALSVAESLNLVKLTEEKGVYELTKVGREFARYLGFRKEKEAKTLLKQILSECKDWEEVLLFLKASIGNPRNPLDLVLHIESKLDKSWSPNVRKKLSGHYKSVLIFAELIDSKADKLVPTISFGEIEEVSTDEQVVTSTKKPPLEETSLVSPMEYTTFSLPNLIVVHVKNTRRAFNFLKKEVREDSNISKWIDLVMESLEQE